MTCRTCKFLEVPLSADGVRRPRKTNAYRCTVVVEQPLMPMSMTRSYDFRWPPSRSYMTPNDGAGCPMHKLWGTT